MPGVPLRFLLALLAPLVAPLAGAVELQPIQLSGVDGELEANVRAHLSVESLSAAQRANISETRLSHLLRAAPEEARQGLEPFGYYNADVQVQLRRDGNKATLQLTIRAGEPVRVRELDLRIDGAAGSDAYVSAPVAAFHPRPGEVLHHGLYETGKAAIARALAEHGYFDAEPGVQRVAVTRAENAADIGLSWTSGDRYQLGTVAFEGQQLRAGVLDPLVPWPVGEPFDQARLLALQKSLVDSDYFSGISLLPEPEKAVDRRVPIKVTLVPGKRSLYNLGLRYGTDSGAGVHARLERRWINDRGHKMLLDLSLAQFKSDFIAQYKVPAFGWLDGWYTYSAVLREEQLDDLTSQTVDIAATRSGRWKRWDLLAGLNFKRERYDSFIADRHDYTTLVFPSVWGHWKQFDDVNTPRRGLGLVVELRAGAPAIGADVAFAQARAEARYIRGLGPDNRLLLRADLGTTLVDGANQLPPSMRFFAGGDRSLRGFGYKEIGERVGDLVFGGKHLAIASVEFEHMFTPAWGGAVFVDAGDAFDQRFRANFGIGAGARWRSPVGPVRIDVAHGSGDDGGGWRLHVTVGPDL